MTKLKTFALLLLIGFSSLEGTTLPQRSNSPISKSSLIRPLVDRISNSKPSFIVHKELIVIDPGHGGSDTGTQSISKPRYKEKSFNLVTAKLVRTYLTQLGYRVEMTREKDKFISLEKRSQFANEKKPSLFVSIHYNSAPSAKAQGVEIFHFQDWQNKQRSNASKKLAQVVLKSILKQTNADSRGVKNGNYAVIRETKMPAILVEGGFLSNEDELKKLKDPAYLKKMAWGIAKGISNYLNSESDNKKK